MADHLLLDTAGHPSTDKRREYLGDGGPPYEPVRPPLSTVELGSV